MPSSMAKSRPNFLSETESYQLRHSRHSGGSRNPGVKLSTLDTIRTKIINIVSDDSGKLVIPDDYNDKVAAALNIYSKHRPDMAVEDITGDAGHDYDLPDAWIEGFSTIQSIEYPVDEVPATLLDEDEWEIYQTADGKVIRLLNDAPGATETFYVKFTILRTATTILAADEDAFCHLAAALCLEELANAFAQSGDSIINADSVNYRTKSSEFAARAKRMLTVYKEYLGIKEDDSVPAASAVTSVLDAQYPGGSDRLTHPRWARRLR